MAKYTQLLDGDLSKRVPVEDQGNNRHPSPCMQAWRVIHCKWVGGGGGGIVTGMWEKRGKNSGMLEIQKIVGFSIFSSASRKAAELF